MDPITIIGVGALLYVLLRSGPASGLTASQSVNPALANAATMAQLQQGQQTNSLLAKLIQSLKPPTAATPPKSSSSGGGSGGGSGSSGGKASGGGSGPGGQGFGTAVTAPSAWDDPYLDQYIQNYSSYYSPEPTAPSGPSGMIGTVPGISTADPVETDILSGILSTPSAAVTLEQPTDPITNEAFDNGFSDPSSTVSDTFTPVPFESNPDIGLVQIDYLGAEQMVSGNNPSSLSDSSYNSGIDDTNFDPSQWYTGTDDGSFGGGSYDDTAFY